MKFRTRSRPTPALPGVSGPARIERTPHRGTPRVREGEIVVIDHLDMDRATAQQLIDAGTVAVVNAAPMISGRYPNLGPRLLADAGIVMVDQVGPEAMRLKDGAALRVDGATVHVGEERELEGRAVDSHVVAAEMEAARTGLSTQLANFTHNSTEFLRREQDVLLHGTGVPEIPGSVGGRPAVVVVASHDWESELRGLRAYLREQRPLLIAVDAAADALRKAGHTCDVVVLSEVGDSLPSPEVLRKALLVVALVERGAGRAVLEPLERIGVSAVRFETSATAEDAGLLMADAADASLVVGVGMHATLDEFLDRRRTGLASTYLTRLKLGPKLVDAAAVPTLYDGAVRPRHVAALAAVGTLVVAAAIAVTPVGQEWAADLGPWLADIYQNVRGTIA